MAISGYAGTTIVQQQLALYLSYGMMVLGTWSVYCCIPSKCWMGLGFS